MIGYPLWMALNFISGNLATSSLVKAVNTTFADFESRLKLRSDLRHFLQTLIFQNDYFGVVFLLQN